jgi:antitoxin VapB
MLTRVYKNNGTYAVRIPKEIADGLVLGDAEIRRVGDSFIINPPGTSWREFFAGPRATDDFMTERNQPPMQERAEIE